MKISTTLLTLALLCLLAGCTKKTRSISQSGYNAAPAHATQVTRELSEFEVLGIDPKKSVTEEDIQNAARQSSPVQLSPGNTILLVQSGAVFPDGPMVAELGKSFRVVPFTGVPNTGGHETRAAGVPIETVSGQRYTTASPSTDPAAYSRMLRLVAARAGATTVVCYWGIIESGTEDYATKTISWMPLLNRVVLDERQHMRIQLKMAVVDVASGNWSVSSVQSPTTTKWSARSGREAADQKQVESLKVKTYQIGARELVRLYAPAGQTTNQATR